MLKKFYIFAWFILIGLAALAAVNGTFDQLALIGTSIGAVALVYAFALWAVTREVQTTN